MKTFILASVVIMCATAALALPNYGPSPPSGADSFGQPPTGYTGGEPIRAAARVCTAAEPPLHQAPLPQARVQLVGAAVRNSV